MKLRFLLPLLFFILIAALLWRGLNLHSDTIPSPLIGKSAPSFTLPTLFNPLKTTTEKDLKGHITLLVVWATWCPSCEVEQDDLMALAKEKDLRLYGFIYKDSPESVKPWLKQHGNPYQMIAVDENGQAAIDWGVYGTPESFLIDKKGIVRYKQTGPITEETWEETLKPLVEKIRNEA